MCAQARFDLAQIIGFDDIIVGPRIQTGDAIRDLVAGGGDENRNLTALPAQIAQKVQPRPVGQRQIQQHGVEIGDAQRAAGGVQIGHMIDGMALALQKSLHGIGNIGVILDQ